MCDSVGFIRPCHLTGDSDQGGLCPVTVVVSAELTCWLIWLIWLIWISISSSLSPSLPCIALISLASRHLYPDTSHILPTIWQVFNVRHSSSFVGLQFAKHYDAKRLHFSWYQTGGRRKSTPWIRHGVALGPRTPNMKTCKHCNILLQCLQVSIGGHKPLGQKHLPVARPDETPRT